MTTKLQIMINNIQLITLSEVIRRTCGPRYSEVIIRICGPEVT